MAATALTTLNIVSPYGSGPGAGVAAAIADTSNGNSFTNDGRTSLLVANSDSSTHTVTILGKSYTIPAEKSVVLGPFPAFEQHGSTVTVTGSDAHLTFLAFSQPHGSTSKR